MPPRLTTPPIVLTPRAIAALREVPTGATEGVRQRVLWRNGNALAGLLTVDAGCRLGRQTEGRDRHLWIVEGQAVVLGAEVVPGSYVHVPGGTEHDVDASTTGGCVVYYLDVDVELGAVDLGGRGRDIRH